MKTPQQALTDIAAILVSQGELPTVALHNASFLHQNFKTVFDDNAKLAEMISELDRRFPKEKPIYRIAAVDIPVYYALSETRFFVEKVIGNSIIDIGNYATRDEAMRVKMANEAAEV